MTIGLSCCQSFLSLTYFFCMISIKNDILQKVLCQFRLKYIWLFRSDKGPFLFNDLGLFSDFINFAAVLLLKSRPCLPVCYLFFFFGFFFLVSYYSAECYFLHGAGRMERRWRNKIAAYFIISCHNRESIFSRIASISIKAAWQKLSEF